MKAEVLLDLLRLFNPSLKNVQMALIISLIGYTGSFRYCSSFASTYSQVDCQNIYNKAVEAYLANQYRESLRLCQKAESRLGEPQSVDMLAKQLSLSTEETRNNNQSELFRTYLFLKLLHLKASSLCLLNNRDSALTFLNKALEINPEHADSLLLRAEIELENNDLAHAFQDANNAIELDNKMSGPYEVLAKISKAKGRKEKSILEDDRAKELRKQREKFSLKVLQDRETNLLLLTLVNREIKLNPNRFNGYFHRSALMQRMGNTQKAIVDANKAVALSHSSLPIKNRAILFASIGDKSKTLKDLNSLCILVGDEPDAVHTKVGCMRDLKMYEEAIEECSIFLRQHPKEVSIYCDRAALEFSRRLFQLAILDCKRALTIKPNSVEALVYLSACQIETGDYSRAVASSTKAITINPSCSLAYNYRAAAYKGLGKFDLATPDIEKAISCENSIVVSLAFKNRSDISAKQGDFEQAIADFESSREFEKQGQSIPVSENELTNEIANYSKLIVRFPNRAEQYLSRGILLISVGRNKEAAKDFSLFCWLLKWNGKSCGYAALLNSYAFTSQGRKREGNLALTEAATKLKAEDRPAELLFFLGKLSEASLLASSSSKTSRSRARFYIALRAVQYGQKSKAMEHIEWLKQFGDPKVEELDMLSQLASVARRLPDRPSKN